MDVVRAPDPKLRIQTKPVKKITLVVVNTINQMIKLTKTFVDPEGVGLASTQVGLEGRFFVAKTFTKDGEKVEENFKVCINPKIVSFSKKTKKFFEGCLSIPNYWGEVERPISVKVSYQDLSGKLVNETLKGFDAHVFQHEVDHLNSILFVDKVLGQKGKFYKFTGKDEAGTDIFEEVTLPA